jgi:hypothetical protein
MSQLSVAEWNDEPEPQPVTQPSASTNNTQPAANQSSRVIENVEPLITTPAEPGYVLEYQQSLPSPPSLPFPPTSNPSSVFLTVEEMMSLHKATYDTTDSYRPVSSMVIELEEAPLPFMDTDITLSPIPEADELPTEPAFAPNVITASLSNTSAEPIISDTFCWGIPSQEDHECHHEGTWDLCLAEWTALNAAMDKAFAPPPFEDIPAWNWGYTSYSGQDPENGGEDNIGEADDLEEDIDMGTF